MAGEPLLESVAQKTVEAVLRRVFGDSEVVVFGDGVHIERKMLARILSSASLLAGRAFEWEETSERRRHSVQLRRLTVLHRNLEALSRLVDGSRVEVSDGDILKILDPGEGKDTPDQRKAPRVDIAGKDLPEQLALVHSCVKNLQRECLRDATLDANVMRHRLEEILETIRSAGGHKA